MKNLFNRFRLRVTNTATLASVAAITTLGGAIQTKFTTVGAAVTAAS